jgi:hypothetical protein
LPEALVRRAGGPAFLCLLCLAAFLSFIARAAHAIEESHLASDTQVWLVTYGPGEIYWESFGHNAIWIRDPELGLDHVFNFGFFDFEQEDFFLHFLQGRLLYFSAAVLAQQEFSQYIDENRSIRAQRLVLTQEQALGLADFLVNQVQPENRDYLYDYFWNNCSTRVRDALDEALGGQIRAVYSGAPARQTMRDLVRRLTVGNYWLYLGLELGMGSSTDQPASRWDEFFIPGELADGMSHLTVTTGSQAQPVVAEDVVLYSSTLPAMPAATGQWWPRYLGAALGLLIVSLVLSRWVAVLRPEYLARTWLLVSGLVGALVLYLAFMTDHTAAGDNMNLIICNPLWILCCAGRKLAVLVARLVLISGATALAFTVLPPHQYNADVLALFLPLNTIAALVLVRRLRRAN